MAPVGNKEERISEAKALAKSGSVHEALQMLLALEKACRLNVEIDGTVSAAEAIIEVCFDSGDWKLLNDHVLIISKRRSQLKQAIVKAVQMCTEYVNRDPCPLPYDNMIELIETLRAVSTGKIFVENERARLTRKLATIREKEGKIEEASDILQEVAPETLGSMDKLEKVDFILEQVRLCLLRKDYVRAGIISNKISAKVIAGENFEPVKFQYYKQMIEFYHSSQKYLAISKAYYALYTSKTAEKDEDLALSKLKQVVVFLLLSPYDNEQNDFLARLAQDRKLDLLAPFKKLVDLFTTQELIGWPFAPEITVELGPQSSIWDGFFTPQLEKDFHKRVIEHNIRVMSKYYVRIRSTRLAQLLHLSVDDMEERLADMVSTGLLYARIDRLEGVVQFRPTPTPVDTLNEWAGDISTLMNMVEETCHLIRKENVLHGIKA